MIAETWWDHARWQIIDAAITVGLVLFVFFVLGLGWVIARAMGEEDRRNG